MQARTKLIASVAAMVAVFVAASAAQASVIAFENPPGPGHFGWPQPAPADNNCLRIHEPSAGQPYSEGSPGGYLQSIDYGTPRNDVSGCGSNTHFQVGGFADVFLLSVSEGTIISATESGFTWGESAIAYHSAHPTGSEIPEGVEAYLGVRFDLGSGFQYGWIGVIRSGPELDAFAWGYETEPGVPIPAGAGIPEPGTISLLLIGAVGVFGRRRR